MLYRSSIVLFVPGRKAAVGESCSASTLDPFGAPWWEKDPIPSFWPLDAAVVRRWILGRGFGSTRDWYVLESGEAKTPLGPEPGIEIHVGRTGGGLADLRVRFTLTASSPDRWIAWAGTLTDLCRTWDLEVVHPYECCLVEGADVLRLLESTSEWRRARETFGWPFVC